MELHATWSYGSKTTMRRTNTSILRPKTTARWLIVPLTLLLFACGSEDPSGVAGPLAGTPGAASAGAAGGTGASPTSSAAPGTAAGGATTGTATTTGTTAADGTTTAADGTTTAADGTTTVASDGTTTGTATTDTGGSTGSGVATIDAPPDPFQGLDCSAPDPGRAPLRRLTSFEYNNTVKELLGDTTNPANSLPAELLGNGFGNDADGQPSSSFLIEQYGTIAKEIAERAVESSSAVDPCVATAAEADEETCARSFLDSFLPRAYRRTVDAAEIDEMLALQQTFRQNETFAGSIADVIETVLQSPDFLYRFEWGTPDATSPALLRPTGSEMASRLSYFLWGSMPSDELLAAADAGELSTPEGVYARAQAMLEDERSRPVIRYFVDHYLPLNGLSDLARDAEQYPTFNATIGSLMREETLRFIEYSIFEGPGDWPSALTAPYTFVNEELANYYGISGVVGSEFQKVDIDTTKRLGLLTQGAIMTGTTVTNFTNPVRRGSFFLRKVMCVDVPDPPKDLGDIKPPDPYSGDTARERYTAHSKQPECAGCHTVLDPAGFALENYDAVGLWRDTENGVTIDASGNLPAIGGSFNGPIELINMIASADSTMTCFAENWTTFAYGRELEEADACTMASVRKAFIDSGYNIKELLLALTQTDAFQYLPTQEASQ
jgi:hypothetical protein